MGTDRSDAAVDDRSGFGSLTDVAGVLVGHHHRIGDGWSTGTTVVFCPGGAVAAVDVRGGGPGTRETDALATTNLVDRIHAVCLTGGSAYGLGAADGVMAGLERLGLGVPVGPGRRDVVPVVPTAVIFDLGRGGRFSNRPGPAFGRAALRSATTDPARGPVGAGAGARAGGLLGGVGMASERVELARTTVTIAALAVLNAAGSPVDPTTGALWVRVPGLRRPTPTERRAVLDALTPGPPLNTTIGVVATDAALGRAELQRLAMSAHDGISRAIRPAHGLTDGDTVFALAPSSTDPAGVVGRHDHADRNRLNAAAADVFERACADAVLSAVSGRHAPAYGDLCPSAWRPTAGRRRPGR